MYALTQKILKYKATHGGTFAEIKKMFTQQNPEDYAHVVQRQTQNTNAKHQNRSNVQKNQATKNPKEQKATSESNNKDLESKSPKPKKIKPAEQEFKISTQNSFLALSELPESGVEISGNFPDSQSWVEQMDEESMDPTLQMKPHPIPLPHSKPAPNSLLQPTLLPHP